MPKIKLSHPSADYINVVSKLSSFTDAKNACGPIAVAIAAGADIKDVVQIFRECGREDGQPTNIKTILSVLKSLTFHSLPNLLSRRK